MDMQQVDLGFVKFEATRQSIIAFVFGFAFFLLSMAIAIIIPPYKAGLVGSGYVIAFGIFFAIIAILYGILAGYSINCMVVGKCIKLSWIMSLLYVVVTVFYFIIFVSSIMMSGANMSRKIK
jgi:hypothetical protein